MDLQALAQTVSEAGVESVFVCFALKDVNVVQLWLAESELAACAWQG